MAKKLYYAMTSGNIPVKNIFGKIEYFRFEKDVENYIHSLETENNKIYWKDYILTN